MALSTTASTTIHHRPPLPASAKTTTTLLRPRNAHQTTATTTVDPQDNHRRSTSLNLPSTLSNLLHIATNRHHTAEDILSLPVDRRTPTSSPREDISSLRAELHGSGDWSSLLKPLHPWLRREIIKYGEFAQATYDAFDANPFSEFCGSALYGCHHLFEKLNLTKHHYSTTKYVYAMSHVELPRWLERSLRSDTWSKDSNWMGFVAVSDDEESRRIGCRDITVAWRGTVAPTEWFEDVQAKLETLEEDDDREVKVEHGFLSIYTSKSETTRYNKSSASEQVMKEIRRLVKHYREKGEQVSLTITGHSLGGALALLNAYEAAATIPDLPVSVISFAAPRVGNEAFGDRLQELGVKVLRLVVKQDVVPKLPGILFNEALKPLESITGELEWVYSHVGVELGLDMKSSPYLKRGGFDLPGFHSLETYLHLVDGYVSAEAEYRSNTRRDVALVNKDTALLREELRIPSKWHQTANKGMALNAYGRWVMPHRAPEDIPSPYRDCRPVALPAA